MEEKIDLRDYLRILTRRWKVVVAIFLATLAAAAVFTFTQSALYEATVTLMEPSYQLVGLEGSLQSMDEKAGQTQKLYPSLVRSLGMAERVGKALETTLSPQEREPRSLLGAIRVEEDRSNPALFRIKARSPDPQKAQEIANAWAEEYVALLHKPGTTPSTELGSVNAQLKEAEEELQGVEEALASFQRETGMGLTSGEMDPYAPLGYRGQEWEEKRGLLANHIVARDNLNLLLQAASKVMEEGGEVTDLPLELLSVEAILDRGQLSPQRIKEEGLDMEEVVALLEREEKAISQAIALLEGEVTTLQEELTADRLQLDRVQRQRASAEEAYLILSRKAQELAIRQRATFIVSLATTPHRPTGPNRALYLAVGTALGLFLGVFGAFALEYLEGNKSEGR